MIDLTLDGEYIGSEEFTIKTKLIILGVNHSYQLVSKECQPAAYKAYFDRVKPSAIGLERAPNEFSVSNFYDFTYEQQDIIIPYAKKNAISVYPFDWLPSSTDQELAWSVGNIERPSFIRGEGTFNNFLSFPKLEEDFFFSERKEIIEKISDWTTSSNSGEADFPRRLFLYRTFMQAMRIKAIAKDYLGQTVLIVVGHMHKNDLEKVLSDISSIEIVQPSEYGYPSEQEISTNIDEIDLFAICSFNLLGLQSEHSFDMKWIKSILEDLDDNPKTAEVHLLKTRLAILSEDISGEEAIGDYVSLLTTVNSDEEFTYTGVIDSSRVDSFFDPFGNLTIQNRLMIELARENYKLNNLFEVESIKNELFNSANLSVLQIKQLEVYWDEYL